MSNQYSQITSAAIAPRNPKTRALKVPPSL
ncbi:hypothetical protein 172859UKE1_109 [Escherichia phage vB_EcoM-172859UKE1]|nr:hypothetical protein 172859UKE1_109 [Escherichia phage vB_EcoM-172859UKE1]